MRSSAPRLVRANPGSARGFVPRIAVSLLAAVLLASCAVNPVTGERHLQFYDSDWEKQVGGQMYAPLKQAGGAEFVLDPELTAYVREVGNRVAGQARRKDEIDFEFSVLNSSVPNAWALPGGKIAINRGLLAQLETEAQLAAVLGHEIVHADAAHGARQQSSGMLAQIGAVASMVVLQGTLDHPAAREIAVLVPAVGAQLIMQKYGRDAEREADEYGLHYLSAAGYDPQGAVALQEVFLALAEKRDDNWLTGLFASHPPSRERIENNRATAADLPPGGTIGRETYAARTAYLRRVQPAYDAYDEAGKALAEDRVPEAQSLIERALDLEPREALFHARLGDIRLEGKDTADARSAYLRSIAANPEHFYPHLRKGQLDFQDGRRGDARSSLQRSLDLLPTAEAHYLLGELDLADRDPRSALAHFQAAAGSNSEAGHKARGQVVRMDLPSNPARYLSVQTGSDRSGRILVQVGNRTEVPVRDVQVQFSWLDANGVTRRDSAVLRGPLAAGKAGTLDTGLKLTDVGDLERRFRAEIIAARPAQP